MTVAVTMTGDDDGRNAARRCRTAVAVESVPGGGGGGWSRGVFVQWWRAGDGQVR